MSLTKNMVHKVDVSHKTVFFIAAFLASLWVLFEIRDVLILLFIAIIFMSALSPLVGRLERLKIPKPVAIAIVYIVIIGFIAGLISLVVTPLIDQTTYLTRTLPQTIENALPTSFIDKNVLQQELSSLSSNALNVTLTIFGQALGFVSVAVLTLYLLLEEEKLDQLVEQFFVGREAQARRIIHKIEEKLGAWLRGQVVLSLIIGAAAYVALFFIGLPTALPLAILAGVLEVVPVIGPIISSLPAILVGYFISPFTAVEVAIAFLVIQQLENHLIVPQVMKKAVGLNPLIVILAVAIGGKLLGIAGALLAVPIAVVIQIVTQEILREETDSKDIIP